MTLDELESRLQKFPRRVLGLWPTPLEEMRNLRKRFGPSCPPLFVKRDDCTVLAGGGSKVRQLEFLIGDALAERADVIVTAGSTSSNHVRLATAAARQCGLNVLVVLGGRWPASHASNVLIARVAGASVKYVGPEDPEVYLLAEAEELRRRGRRPYVIPVGGASPVGVLGYVLAAVELARQMGALGIEFDRVVVASGSGGTQAGLTLGMRLVAPQVRVLGVSVGCSEAVLRQRVAHLVVATARLLGTPVVEPDGIAVTENFLPPGYPEPSVSSLEACLTFAREEGILVDPVYTGRAAAALIDQVRGQKVPSYRGVCFWHTGGLPNIFERADDLWAVCGRDSKADR